MSMSLWNLDSVEKNQTFYSLKDDTYLFYVYINGGFKNPFFLQTEKHTHVLHITLKKWNRYYI